MEGFSYILIGIVTWLEEGWVVIHEVLNERIGVTLEALHQV